MVLQLNHWTISNCTSIWGTDSTSKRNCSYALSIVYMKSKSLSDISIVFKILYICIVNNKQICIEITILPPSLFSI